MFSNVSIFFDNYWRGLRTGLRGGNGLTPLAVLYFTLSLLLGICSALGSAWWRATTDHLNKNGLGRVTVEATNSDGLNSANIEILQKHFPASEGFRVIPQYTSAIYLKAADGHFKPFLATSTVNDDPLLLEAPSLPAEWTRQLRQQPGSRRGDGLILSPDLMRRLGFTQPSDFPSTLQVRIHAAGNNSQAWNFELPVSDIAGELGQQGIRVPLEWMLAIRRYQCLGPNAGNSSEEIEVNAIHVTIPAKRSFDEMIDRLKSIDPSLQLSSPYFERGKQRSLLSVAVRLASPLLALLIASNAIVLWVLIHAKVTSDRVALAMLRMSGASNSAVVAWYALPLITLAAVFTLAGICIAKLFTQFQLLPLLASSTQQQSISTSLSFSIVWLLIMGVSGLVNVVLTHRQSATVTESAWSGSC